MTISAKEFINHKNRNDLTPEEKLDLTDYLQFIDGEIIKAVSIRKEVVIIPNVRRMWQKRSMEEASRQYATSGWLVTCAPWGGIISLQAAMPLPSGGAHHQEEQSAQFPISPTGLPDIE